MPAFAGMTNFIRLKAGDFNRMRNYSAPDKNHLRPSRRIKKTPAGILLGRRCDK
jgi:hypothetical protein